MTEDVGKVLGEKKVDAILCVAGGWAGGSAKAKCKGGSSHNALFFLFPMVFQNGLFLVCDGAAQQRVLQLPHLMSS